MELLCKIAGAGKTAGESDIRYGKISGNKLFGCQEQPFLLKIFHGRTMKILTEKPLADTGTDVDDSSDFFDGKVMFEIESIILFTGVLSFLLIAGLHLMRELDIFLKKDKKEREEERYRGERKRNK